MKFGKNLLRVEGVSDPAWSPFWMNYKVLKKLIKQLPNVGQPDENAEANNSNSTSAEETNLPASGHESVPSTRAEAECRSGEPSLASPASSPKSRADVANGTKRATANVLGQNSSEVGFFRLLHAELRKSVRFFDRTMAEFTIRVTRLHEGAEIMKRSTCTLVDDKWLVMARSAFKLYKELVLLETYAIMTYCAFSKILKKHDKMTGRNTRNAFMKAMVCNANFSDTTKLQHMIRQSQMHYSEASSHLEKDGGTANLKEDERLFIDLITQINGDTRGVIDEEGAPGRPTDRSSSHGPKSLSHVESPLSSVEVSLNKQESAILSGGKRFPVEVEVEASEIKRIRMA